MAGRKSLRVVGDQCSSALNWLSGRAAVSGHPPPGSIAEERPAVETPFLEQDSVLHPTSGATMLVPPARRLELAVIGDSLTTGFCLSSIPAMIWAAHARARCNWFADTTGRIQSVLKRAAQEGPVLGHQFSTVSARVDETRKRLSERLLGTRHFSEQVAKIANLSRFPDIVLVWIGHNDLDWVQNQPAPHMTRSLILRQIVDRFMVRYQEQLNRLLSAAALSDHPTAIVVYALVNFRRFFVARERAEQISAQSSHRYRRALDGYTKFASMRPEYRDGMIELSDLINEALRRTVEATSAQACLLHVTLRYSTALYDTDLSSEVALSDTDGWHPSTYGHGLLAAGAYQPIEDIVQAFRAHGRGKDRRSQLTGS
jgi:lysophospholipase L1-like esterase